MKPKSEFVSTLLAMCSVVSVQFIQAGDIKADHIREMDRAMTPEAKEVLLDLSSLADEKMKEVTLSTSEEAFKQSGLSEMSADEAFLLTTIYGSQGRKMQITPESITVWPCQKMLDEKSRRERLKKQIA